MVGFEELVGRRDDVGRVLGIEELVGLDVVGICVGENVHGGYVGIKFMGTYVCIGKR